MSKILKISTAIAVLITLGVFLYFDAPPDRPSEPPSKATSANAKPPAAPLTMSAPEAAVGSPNAAKPELATTAWDSSKFFKDLHSSKDLRVFAEAAKRAPESGGMFYAGLAVSECRLLRQGELAPEALRRLRTEIATSTAPMNRKDARTAALNWTEERCRSFTDNELSLEEMKTTLSSREALRDPLMNMRKEASKLPTGKLDTDQRLRLLTSLLDTHDPSLLTYVRGVSAAPTGSNPAFAVHVDSLPYGGLDAVSFDLAWWLMTCKLAGTCGTGDARTMSTCAVVGQCANSILEYVKMRSGPQFGRVSAVSDRLLQIVVQGDARALLPPK